MNPGPAEEGIKVAGSFVDALKREPLSLSLVVMNICLLIFSWFILSAVAEQTADEVKLLYADNKEVRELLVKCVIPQRIP